MVIVTGSNGLIVARRPENQASNNRPSLRHGDVDLFQYSSGRVRRFKATVSIVALKRLTLPAGRQPKRPVM